MIDKYGCPRPGKDEHFGRPALLSRALASGCDASDLAAAYNLSSPNAVQKMARRYRERNGKPK